jgi:uncharacterized protein YndB with AHSA1/START domain
MSDLTIHLKKTINAPVEKVFNAWLDADSLSRFMTPMPGMPNPRTECDGREGGRFAIYMLVNDKEIPHTGTYLEIKPHSKIVFTWESPFSIDGSTVTILFNSLDGNRTEIDFNHVKFISDEERNDHEGGWTYILEVLEEIVREAEKERASA